jgi:hypothetical protein
MITEQIDDCIDAMYRCNRLDDSQKRLNTI